LRCRSAASGGPTSGTRWAAPSSRRALAEGNTEAHQAALDLFDTLGARPAADALRRQIRDAGVRGRAARRTRQHAQRHPCGLTNVEMTVLSLMVQDLRNADIAARLHRSVRTVDHHVAAVLAKLGVESRLAAAQPRAGSPQAALDASAVEHLSQLEPSALIISVALVCLKTVRPLLGGGGSHRLHLAKRHA
jgi:DNA-binding NarL/FixJ family response regulator